MLITTEGAVISVRDAGDNDRFITILSPEMGLVDISVKGAKKLNSKSNSSTQLFACAKYCFNERSGRYYLNSCEPVKTFYGLRLDMQRLSLASYMAEIISYTVTSGQSANDVYRLFMNSLYLLSEKGADCAFVKFVFEMRIAADLGMMPNLLGCDECYRSDCTLCFLIKRGIFLCYDHMETRVVYHDKYNVDVTAGMFEAIRFVCLSDMSRIFNFRVSGDALLKLGYISELYAQVHFDRHFKTLDFYNSIAMSENNEDTQSTNEENDL